MTRPDIARERWIALFFLGVAAFSPPLLQIFSADNAVFGIPILYVYMFAAWGVIVAFMAWIAEAQIALEARERGRGRGQGGERKRVR